MSGEKSVRLNLLGNNKDAKAKIEEVDVAADELKAKHPELSIGIDTAAAGEKLAILRTELRETTKDAKSLKRQFAEVKFEKLGSGAKWAGLFAAASGPLPAILGTVAAGTVSVGAALVPAVAGLGLFGLVVKSGITDVENADAANKKLSGGLGELQKSVHTASSAWTGFTNSALKNGAADTVSRAINLIPVALSKLSPLLKPVESALNGIIGKLGTGLDSSGFAKFMKTLTGNAGPSLQKVADIFGHLGSMVGKTVEAFQPLGQSVLTVVDKLFAKADAGTGSALQKFLNWVSQEGPAAMGILRNLGSSLLNIGKAFGGVSGSSMVMFTALSSLLAGIAAHPIGADALAGLLVVLKIAPMVVPLINLAKAFKALSEAEWLVNIASTAFTAVPIVAVVVGIGVAVYLLITHWKQFKAAALDVWHAVTVAGKDAFNWVKGHWPLILGILAGPIALAAGEIIQHWRLILDGAEHMFNAVVGFFREMPGRIVSVLGNLGGLLSGAGAAIMGGFLSGIERGFDAVKNFVGGIAGWIGAHKGPVSYDATVLIPHGKAFMQGLVGGFQAGMPLLSQQLAKTTSTIASTRMPGASGAGSGTALQVEWIGGSGADQEFITWLKKNIRFRGGDPGVLGR